MAFGPCIDWLVAEYFRIAVAYKEKLPTKARKFKYPHFLWVAAVYHNEFFNGNVYREKFNQCLKSAVDKHHGMRVLHLPSWNPQDVHTVTNRSINGKGFDRDWEAVNDAFQFWDKEQMRNAHAYAHGSSRKGFPNHGNSSGRNDRFHWSSRKNNRN